LIFSLLSCSTKILNSNIKKTQFCLSSEGRGRLEGPSNKVIFSYESLFDKNNLYDIVFDFQLHGEENLSLSQKLKWSGSLLQKTFFNANRNEIADLEMFFKHLATFFKLIKSNHIGEHIKINKFDYVYTNGQFQVTGLYNGLKFKHLKITYQKVYSGYKYKMDLIASECH